MANSYVTSCSSRRLLARSVRNEQIESGAQVVEKMHIRLPQLERSGVGYRPPPLGQMSRQVTAASAISTKSSLAWVFKAVNLAEGVELVDDEP